MTHAVNVIAAAFPRHTGKALERELGCTSAQAERIIRTGHIPARLWTHAERIFEKALEANEERIREARETLKAIRYARMVGRAEGRAAAVAARSAGACDALDSETDEGQPLPLVGGGQ